ncbi:MAG TPA: hypothetical protein VJX28_07220, partial [Chthoniobacterales bacterium]|nr:hypothetical protein [Chthoniobacterales bacterium]
MPAWSGVSCRHGYATTLGSSGSCLRASALSSLALLAGGVALTTLIRSPWQLVLLWGVLVGIGTGMTAIVLGATVVHQWFRRHRGLMIGILTASTATGRLLFLPVLCKMRVRLQCVFFDRSSFAGLNLSSHVSKDEEL